MGKREHFMKSGLLVSFAEIGNKRLSLAGCLCVYGMKKKWRKHLLLTKIVTRLVFGVFHNKNTSRAQK